MTSFVLGSKPLIELTQKSYEMTATNMMMLKSFTNNLEEIDALNSQINELVKLVDHCKDVLKQMED